MIPESCSKNESGGPSPVFFAGDYPSLALVATMFVGIFLVAKNSWILLSSLHVPVLLIIIMQQLIVFLGVPVIIVLSRGINPRTTFSLRRPSVAGVVLTLLLVIPVFIGLLGLGAMQETIVKTPQRYIERFESLVVARDVGAFFLIVFAVSILPGICEETLFRGFLQSSLHARYSPGGVIIAASLCFGIFHFDPYNFLGPAVLALYLGYILYRTRCIFYCMLSHAAYNFCVIIFFNSSLRGVVEKLNLMHAVWAVCAALPLIMVGCRVLSNIEGVPSPGWVSFKKSGLTYYKVQE